MNCYEHENKNAHGICHGCGKGFCKECAVETNAYITCSSECSAYMNNVKEMNLRGMKLYGLGKEPSGISPALLMWLLFGFMFLAWTAYQYFVLSYLDIFAGVFGFFCLFLAGFTYKRIKDIGLNC